MGRKFNLIGVLEASINGIAGIAGAGNGLKFCGRTEWKNVAL